MALPRPELLDLSEYLDPQRVIMLRQGITKTEALDELAGLCGVSNRVRDPAHFVAAIHERERVSSTGIGGGIAVPHAKLQTIDSFVMAIGICPSGIDFAARDGEPVSIVVMIAASDHLRERYLKLLATVATWLKQPECCAKIRQANGATEVIAALCQP